MTPTNCRGLSVALLAVQAPSARREALWAELTNDPAVQLRHMLGLEQCVSGASVASAEDVEVQGFLVGWNIGSACVLSWWTET